jgi:hypothetical protein
MTAPFARRGGELFAEDVPLAIAERFGTPCLFASGDEGSYRDFDAAFAAAPTSSATR